MRLSNAKALKVIKYWLEIFAVDDFYSFETKVNNAPDASLAEDLREAHAFIEVDGSYGKNVLTINAYNFNADALDDVISHEIGHVILNDVAEMLAELAGERLTQTTTKMIEQANERFCKAMARLRKRTKRS